MKSAQWDQRTDCRQQRRQHHQHLKRHCADHAADRTAAGFFPGLSIGQHQHDAHQYHNATHDPGQNDKAVHAKHSKQDAGDCGDQPADAVAAADLLMNHIAESESITPQRIDVGSRKFLLNI